MDPCTVIEGTTQSRPLNNMCSMTQHPIDMPTPEQQDNSGSTLQERRDSNMKFLMELHCQYLAYDEDDQNQDSWLFRGEDEDYLEAG